MDRGLRAARSRAGRMRISPTHTGVTRFEPACIRMIAKIVRHMNHVRDADQDSYADTLRSIKRVSKSILSGSPRSRKRKALAFLVLAGIATPSGRLTAKYR